MRRRVKKRIVAIWKSLSFKLFLVLMSIMIILFILYASLCSTLQKHIYEETIRTSAYRTSDVIKKSLYRLMLSNQRDELYYTLKLIGGEPGIERIRIYNKKGEIKYSTDSIEIGQTVNMSAEACYLCHTANKPLKRLKQEQKSRIYKSDRGYRVMGLINPIRNAPECSNQLCHAHNSRQVFLGILDVQMSLENLDQAVARARRTVVGSSFAFLLVSLILFAGLIYLVIYKPIQKLELGTVSLAMGDLDYRIQMEREDELGMLARSFNHMADNLKRAYTELKSWSQRLEARIQEKTEQLERMHRGMLQVEKMASLGKMAASVAHELNNPLAGIVTYSKLLEKRISRYWQDGAEKEKVLKELALIRSESLRCGNIVSNLLVFSRGRSPRFQPCSIPDIVQRALGIVRHHLELANIKVNVRFDSHEIMLDCDSDQIIQALVALIVNAVEAMPEGGTLDINAGLAPDDPEKVLLRISDTGIGIPEEIRDKIFEPFFSTKKEQKGVGLGLAVVYGIIQHHRGKIRVESRVGEGATFFIELPLHASSEHQNTENE